MESGLPLFPETLPTPLVGRMHQIGARRQTVRMESSRIRSRRLDLEAFEAIEAQWNFTGDQFDAFKVFFDEELENGSIPFVLRTLEPHANKESINAVARDVAFIGNYSFVHSDNLFSVSALLEVDAEVAVEITNPTAGVRGLYPATFTYACPGTGNFVTTAATPHEFPWNVWTQTYEDAYDDAEDSLEEEGEDQLDCSVEACIALPAGVAVEASLPFETQCVGGLWYSDPLPNLNDRWTVNKNP